MELKPCPFCGKEAVMQTVTTAMEKEPRFRVICTKCVIATDWDFWKPEDVAKHWNRRAHEGSEERGRNRGETDERRGGHESNSGKSADCD